MLTHTHLKKKKSESLKIEQHCPIDQKFVQKIFLKVKTPELSLYRTQTPKKSNAVFCKFSI